MAAQVARREGVMVGEQDHDVGGGDLLGGGVTPVRDLDPRSALSRPVPPMTAAPATTTAAEAAAATTTAAATAMTAAAAVSTVTMTAMLVITLTAGQQDRAYARNRLTPGLVQQGRDHVNPGYVPAVRPRAFTGTPAGLMTGWSCSAWRQCAAPALPGICTRLLAWGPACLANDTRQRSGIGALVASKDSHSLPARSGDRHRGLAPGGVAHRRRRGPGGGRDRVLRRPLDAPARGPDSPACRGPLVAWIRRGRPRPS